MWDSLINALISALVSAIITGCGVYYLHIYLDNRRKESEARAVKRREERRRADVLEQQRRHAEGRCIFWFHDAITKGVEHANGDLEKAYQVYSAAENAQKTYEQELLAEHQDENRIV